MVSGLSGRLACLLVGYLVSWLASLLTVWLACWLGVDWLVSLFIVGWLAGL